MIFFSTRSKFVLLDPCGAWVQMRDERTVDDERSRAGWRPGESDSAEGGTRREGCPWGGRTVNPVAQIDATGQVVQRHLWGTDLSGTPQGAGGMGGLLGTWDHGSTTRDGSAPGDGVARVWVCAYDGNGNVSAAIAATVAGGASGNGGGAGTVRVAGYNYDAFGKTLATWGDGTVAGANRYRFSTKPEDGTRLLYYGYRYLDTRLGRWVSRDPIGEEGGENLMQVALNDIKGKIDFLGLSFGHHLVPQSAFKGAPTEIAALLNSRGVRLWSRAYGLQAIPPIHGNRTLNGVSVDEYNKAVEKLAEYVTMGQDGAYRKIGFAKRGFEHVQGMTDKMIPIENYHSEFQEHATRIRNYYQGGLAEIRTANRMVNYIEKSSRKPIAALRSTMVNRSHSILEDPKTKNRWEIIYNGKSVRIKFNGNCVNWSQKIKLPERSRGTIGFSGIGAGSFISFGLETISTLNAVEEAYQNMAEAAAAGNKAEFEEHVGTLMDSIILDGGSVFCAGAVYWGGVAVGNSGKWGDK